MNCQKAFELMNKYIDQEITPEEEKVLEFHLLSCRNCQKIFGELKELNIRLNSLQPSKNFTTNVMQKVKEIRGRKQKIVNMIRKRGWLVVAAVVVLFFIININGTQEIIVDSGQLQSSTTKTGEKALIIKDGHIRIKNLEGTLNAINSQIIIEKPVAGSKFNGFSLIKEKINQFITNLEEWISQIFRREEVEP